MQMSRRRDGVEGFVCVLALNLMLHFSQHDFIFAESDSATVPDQQYSLHSLQRFRDEDALRPQGGSLLGSTGQGQNSNTLGCARTRKQNLPKRFKISGQFEIHQ